MVHGRLGAVGRASRCACVAAIASACLIAAAWSAGPPGGNAADDLSRLTLALRTARRTYALYEPVDVTATLTNPLPRAVEIQVYGVGFIDRFAISIQPDGGAPTRYRFGVIADVLGAKTLRLAPAGEPGSSLTETTVLFYNDKSRDLAFPRPGRYRVHGEVPVGNAPKPVLAKAEPVSIEIDEPQGDDVRFIEALRGHDRLVILLRRGPSEYCREDTTGGCYASLRDLVGRLPGSGYAPHVLRYLSSAVGYGRPGDPRPDLEYQMLLEFLRRWPEHPLAPNVMQEMASFLLNTTSSPLEALDWAERFETLYPDRASPRRLIDPTGEISKERRAPPPQ